ncbi:hypothetical protein QQ045_025146 [Rhodiola kirilowii]
MFPINIPATVAVDFWKSFAGTNVPEVGTLVYYFPERHAEQCDSPPALAPPVWPIFPCRVLKVRYLADRVRDEVFAAVLLQSVGSDFRGDNPVPTIPSTIDSYSKVLSPTDTLAGQPLWVPVKCARAIFPPLNYNRNQTFQNLTIADVHGVVWGFEHVYRGKRRHLFRKGWGEFVQHKQLVAGDTVVFIRHNRTGRLYIAIRRKSPHMAGLSARFVEEALQHAKKGKSFEVFLYPRIPEYVLNTDAVLVSQAALQFIQGIDLTGDYTPPEDVKSKGFEISEGGDDETPLQVKLNGVATIIGKIGLFFAVITFAVLVQGLFNQKLKEGCHWDWSADDAVVGHPASTTVLSSPSAVPVNNGVHSVSADVKRIPITANDNGPSQSAITAFIDAASRDIEEAKKGMAVTGKISVTPVEEKPNESEPLQYATKQEAKIAFKALLESAKVESDWTWDQAMRVIVNDKRYGALRTLGERKQAFNEYLGQRKKLEAEERRMKQKKAREEFTKMLEDCRELTSSTRWREALVLFENDERFKAVERVRDREDLFDSYMVELQKKEKAMAQEKRKQDLADFRKFLESCHFIKASTQWRRVQDRLEDDERCLRLEKVDRLLVFQDYIRDLEVEEEEQKKLQKEQLRRAECTNRDAFRKLMDEHVADGTLTAKTQWRDYCMKVKESLPYTAVASNTSGSTPKDLFEDVSEELQNKYHEDKTRIKELTNSGKLVVTSTWTFEDFKEATKEDIGSPPISDTNLNALIEAWNVETPRKGTAQERPREACFQAEIDHLI